MKYANYDCNDQSMQEEAVNNTDTNTHKTSILYFIEHKTDYILF